GQQSALGGRPARNASAARRALPADTAHLPVPPPFAAGPPCARPRTTSRQTPAPPDGSHACREAGLSERPHASATAFVTGRCAERSRRAEPCREGRRQKAFPFRDETSQENMHMLVAYDVALDLVRALRPVVGQLRQYSADAADQVERAASSIVLNLAEGFRRHGRDPRRFYDMAHGSAGEIRGALDLADAWGWQVEGTHARALLDRELGLLWGLTRRTRSKTTPEHPR